MEVFDGKRNLWSQITAALTNENGTTTNASTAVAVIDMKSSVASSLQKNAQHLSIKLRSACCS